MATVENDGNELRRMFALAELGDRGVVLEISADADERAALARRFGIRAIGALSASLRLDPMKGGAVVRVRGEIVADVVQNCVVTLEPVEAHIEEDFERSFAPGGDVRADVEVAPEGDDGPEPLDGDEIDLGEVIAEQLGVNLDPYPRRPGVLFSPQGANDEVGAGDGGPAPTESPFARLRDLLRRTELDTSRSAPDPTKSET